jgi:hypothetical protein
MRAYAQCRARRASGPLLWKRQSLAHRNENRIVGQDSLLRTEYIGQDCDREKTRGFLRPPNIDHDRYCARQDDLSPVG